MALRLVTDDLPSTVTTTTTTAAVVPPHPVALSSAEITGLIGLFQTMLDRTERNILDRLDENAKGAADRWRKHDEELAANTRRIVDRFEKVETAIATTSKVLEDHLAREHDEDVRMDARIRPIRGSIGWLWAHWRDIVLLIIGLIALGTFLVEATGRVLGTHLP